MYASVVPFALFYFTQREQCGGSCSRWTTVVLLIAVMGDQLNFFQGFQLVAFCAKEHGRRSVRVLAKEPATCGGPDLPMDKGHAFPDAMDRLIDLARSQPPQISREK